LDFVVETLAWRTSRHIDVEESALPSCYPRTVLTEIGRLHPRAREGWESSGEMIVT
jgi:hypothetical protein